MNSGGATHQRIASSSAAFITPEQTVPTRRHAPTASDDGVNQIATSLKDLICVGALCHNHHPARINRWFQLVQDGSGLGKVVNSAGDELERRMRNRCEHLEYRPPDTGALRHAAVCKLG